MNIRRALLGLWTVASILWMGAFAWLIKLPCTLGPYAPSGCTQIFDDLPLTPAQYIRIASLLLGPPLAVLAAALVIRRAWRGAVGNQPSV